MGLRTYVKSFFSFSIGTWIGALISFFTTPIVSYLIIPEEFGRASMFTLVYSILLTTCVLGLDQSFVRFYYEMPQEKRKSLFWESVSLPLINSILASIILVIFQDSLSRLLFQSSYPNVGLLLSVSLLTGILQAFNQLSIRMQKKGLMFSSIQIISSVSNVSFTIIYAKFISANFYAVIFGQICGNIVALFVGSVYDKASRSLSSVSYQNIKKYIRYGIPFLPTFLISWLFNSIDRISLRQYSTFTEIGLYSAAFKLVSAMNLIQTGFTTFWSPLVYERYSNKPEDKEFYRKAFLGISLVMYLFGLTLIGLKDIIFLLFSKSYRDAAYIAPFLILMPVMYSISEVTVVGINFKKKTYWHMLIAAVSALANYIGNTLLVPILGGKGAAISTGLSYIVFFAMRTIISEKLYPVKYDISRIVFGNIVMVAVALIGTFQRGMTASILSAGVGILVILWLYKREVKSLFSTFKTEFLASKN
ncbi:MAG: polysaccharide biosynthesis protein [Thermotogaceae bacterium]|nr:polysaccharide biosynthesis protein [Thermotogaceae bacterium]